MKRYYAVIDTNVLVSSMLKADSIPGKIIDLTLTESRTRPTATKKR